MIPEGLVKFDPNSKKIINRYSFKNWTNLDNDWFDITMNAIKTRDGRLIFSTKSGILDFHPDSIQINTIPPKITLTDFKLFNKTVEIGEDAPLQKDIAQTHFLNLAHFQNDLSFEVAALHFKNAESNQYAHWLEGYELGLATYWHTKENISYTNLNPGSYILKIKAANSDGVWTEQPLELPITIFPPWYQTWWAYLALDNLNCGGNLRTLSVSIEPSLGTSRSAESQRTGCSLKLVFIPTSPTSLERP